MKHVIRRREDRGTGYLRCMMSDVGGRREEYKGIRGRFFDLFCIKGSGDRILTMYDV